MPGFGPFVCCQWSQELTFTGSNQFSHSGFSLNLVRNFPPQNQWICPCFVYLLAFERGIFVANS